MAKRGGRMGALATALLLAAAAWGQASAPPAAIPLPPMGWATWNSFGNQYNERTIAAEARALVRTGMQQAGYRYVLLDEGWWQGRRQAQGNIVVNPRQWPGGMARVTAYLHKLGLKAGIYTDAGSSGCGTFYPDSGPGTPGTGSLGHYGQDILQFARWGFDYVKVDWCGGDRAKLDPATQYAAIARAIQRAEAITGRKLFFSLCEWGRQSPWTWAPGVGGITADMWRTSGDISAPIVASIPAESNRWVSLPNIYRNFDAGLHPAAQHTGFYNDLDMMVLGMRGMSLAADRVHMSLWAIAGAPLMEGADLTRLTAKEAAILTNRDAVAIDQDPLGLQAVEVAAPGPGLQVWAKPLAGQGRRAVVLLNRGNAPAAIRVNWNELGFAPGGATDVHAVWTGQDLGPQPFGYTATVPPRDAVMLVVQGQPQPGAAKYRPEAASEPGEPAGEVRFTGIPGPSAHAWVSVVYRNNGSRTAILRLQVNADEATRVAFPPTAGAARSVCLEASLVRAQGNVLRFTPLGIGHADLRAIEIRHWP